MTAPMVTTTRPASIDGVGALSVRATRSWAEVADIWRRLYDARPDASFFLSPQWLEAWLEIFADIRRPEFLVFTAAREPVAVCALVPTLERRGPFHLRALYINGGSEEPADRSAVEFNDVLCLPGAEHAMARAPSPARCGPRLGPDRGLRVPPGPRPRGPGHRGLRGPRSRGPAAAQLLRGPGAAAGRGPQLRRCAEPEQAVADPQVRPHVRAARTAGGRGGTGRRSC